ncbi:MAG: hypothetical protein PVS3B3_21400 [Ktedonobacteraceae bacterium]
MEHLPGLTHPTSVGSAAWHSVEHIRHVSSVVVYRVGLLTGVNPDDETTSNVVEPHCGERRNTYVTHILVHTLGAIE